jgi:hypothetical protein
MVKLKAASQQRTQNMQRGKRLIPQLTKKTWRTAIDDYTLQFVLIGLTFGTVMAMDLLVAHRHSLHSLPASIPHHSHGDTDQTPTWREAARCEEDVRVDKRTTVPLYYCLQLTIWYTFKYYHINPTIITKKFIILHIYDTQEKYKLMTDIQTCTLPSPLPNPSFPLSITPPHYMGRNLSPLPFSRLYSAMKEMTSITWRFAAASKSRSSC